MDSSLARARLNELDAERAELKAGVEATEREQFIRDLEATREEKRKANTRHAELMSLAKIQSDAFDLARQKIERAQAAVADSLQRRPDVADYLPNDPECIEWLIEHRRLEADLETQIAERKKLVDPNATIAEANRFEGPSGIVATLDFRERNLLIRLQGGMTKAWAKSGISGVVL
jgi:hypothetical protein